ncbi:MAG TPA: peptidylprolyl isomerase, partial [Hyphomonadaceae bacterium]|nr:peptidylprolyl isomerase [Hyphomonadaceae bacterium]
DDVTGERALGVSSFLKRAIREPLLHFLAIGLALFAVNAIVNGADEGETGETIVISEGRVNQIAESFLLLSGRPATRDELAVLVDDFVSEEVGYREAVAMGLDADDSIVRRRMRQKLEFLIEDGAASEEPTEEQLQQWLDANPDAYRLPERRSIRQVLASADKRGAATESEAAALLIMLRDGADPAKLGDRSMLPAAMPLTTQEGVASLFGADFAKAAFTRAGEGWFGPVASPFGQHLMLVMEIEPGRTVLLAEVREKVRSDWIEHRRNEARDKFHARMRQRYDIRIDWPTPWKDLPQTPDPNPKTRPSPEVGE